MPEYRSRLLVRTSAPATEPLTLTEAKLYLRVDGTEEDSLITSLIKVVREQAEEYLRASLMPQSWRLEYECSAPARVALPRGPVTAISSVVLINESGGETTFASVNYHLSASTTELVFNTTPISHRVQINYETGYVNEAAIPAGLKHGMLTHLTRLYELRGEGEEGVPDITRSLYTPFRNVRLS